MNKQRVYKPVRLYTHDEIESAIKTDDLGTLVRVAFSSAMLDADWKFTQDLCVRLADHRDKTVRGNAILGLEYLARFQGKLEKHVAKPLLLRALKDNEHEVVERATDAIRIINRVMNWRIGERRKSVAVVARKDGGK